MNELRSGGTPPQVFPTRRSLRLRGQEEPASRFRLGLHPVTIAALIAALVPLSAIGVVRAGGSLPLGLEPKVVAAQVSQGRAEMQSVPEIAEQEDEGDLLVVFVSGEVKSPGVVTVPLESRVEAAVEQAGGLTKDADLQAVNLARRLGDGEHVHIPGQGESVASSGGGAAEAQEHAPCVDLNQASAAELESLDGVGPKIAERILSRRSELGGFGSNEELLSVSGIGAVMFERISAGLCQ